MCHDLICRICGDTIERKASGKGRVPEYHATCKTFAQAMLNMDRALDGIQFARSEHAQTQRSTMMAIINRIPAQYHATRDNGRFVKEA